ncbi:unnamed protein product [Effrenium voratum]|nr:unnamed protein product [Effrenium voratum]
MSCRRRLGGWRQLPGLTNYHRTYGIATMCMAPLARGEMFGKTDMSAIAREVGRSEAEVAIRWCQQLGFIPIPRSVQPDRILVNAASGLELSASQMERIRALDSNYIACRKASPCCELPWDAIAEHIPEKSMWDESHRRSAAAAAQRAKQREERAQKASARKARQMKAQAAIAAWRSAVKALPSDKKGRVPCHSLPKHFTPQLYRREGMHMGSQDEDEAQFAKINFQLTRPASWSTLQRSMAAP